MPVYRLDKNNISFPNPRLARSDGLLAVGGDLCIERLLLAYTHGIFPWYNPGDEIMWWCPKERFVIIPKEIHISCSMKRYMKKHMMQIVVNRDFGDVMHRCRMKREQEEGTWISGEMEEAYGRLHQAGLAQLLEQNCFLFIDCQFHTEHLESMGGKYISWEEYDKMLTEGAYISDGKL